MPPRKKSNTGLIIGIVIGAIVLCCIGPAALVGGGIFWGFSKVAKPLAECSATLQAVRDGARDYAKDHGNKLPPAENWRDEIRSYYAKDMTPEPGNPFKAQGANETWGCDDMQGGRTLIAYNADVAGKAESDISRDDVVFFEVKAATGDAVQKYTEQPFEMSPKIVNEPRGWFIIYMEGEPGFIGRRGQFQAFQANSRRR